MAGDTFNYSFTPFPVHTDEVNDMIANNFKLPAEEVKSLEEQLKEANEKITTLQGQVKGATDRAQKRFLAAREANREAEIVKKVNFGLEFNLKDLQLKLEREKTECEKAKRIARSLKEQLDKEKALRAADKTLVESSKETTLAGLERAQKIRKEAEVVEKTALYAAAAANKEAEAAKKEAQHARSERDFFKKQHQQLVISIQSQKSTYTHPSRAQNPEQSMKASTVPQTPATEPNKKRKLNGSISPQQQNSTLNGRSSYAPQQPQQQSRSMQSPPKMAPLQQQTTTAYGNSPLPPMQQHNQFAQPSYMPSSQHRAAENVQHLMQSRGLPTPQFLSQRPQHNQDLAQMSSASYPPSQESSLPQLPAPQSGLSPTAGMLHSAWTPNVQSLPKMQYPAPMIQSPNMVSPSMASTNMHTPNVLPPALQQNAHERTKSMDAILANMNAQRSLGTLAPQSMGTLPYTFAEQNGNSDKENNSPKRRGTQSPTQQQVQHATQAQAPTKPQSNSRKQGTVTSTYFETPVPGPAETRVIACTNCRDYFWDADCDNGEPCGNCIESKKGDACVRMKCERYDGEEKCNRRESACPRAHADCGPQFERPLKEFAKRDRKIAKSKKTLSPLEEKALRERGDLGSQGSQEPPIHLDDGEDSVMDDGDQ